LKEYPSPAAQLDELLARPEPLLALAPMQDVTDLPFWTLLAKYGGPDVYYTEFFRVHRDSHLERHILRSITENPTGRPVIAQMIGNDIPALVRTSGELQRHAIAGVDLNLGCPAPVVYKKCAGGGLLREPERVEGILAALRAAVGCKFTVKTRVGFEDAGVFPRFLDIFARSGADLLTVHGRTVKEMYGPVVHYDLIAAAARAMPFPVLANGNVDSAERALRILRETGARGLMIGRGAIRNPWIFEQIRRAWRGEGYFKPRGRDVLEYVHALYEAVKPPNLREEALVQKMKKYMNFVAAGADAEGRFVHEIRRVSAEKEFFEVCARHLDHDRELEAWGGVVPERAAA